MSRCRVHTGLRASRQPHFRTIGRQLTNLEVGAGTATRAKDPGLRGEDNSRRQGTAAVRPHATRIPGSARSSSHGGSCTVRLPLLTALSDSFVRKQTARWFRRTGFVCGVPRRHRSHATPYRFRPPDLADLYRTPAAGQEVSVRHAQFAPTACTVLQACHTPSSTASQPLHQYPCTPAQ